MQEKFQAMDARLDGLVAEMNAAQGIQGGRTPWRSRWRRSSTSWSPSAKALRAMQMEMQPAMMAHMMHHMHGMKGEMECPMMKKDGAPEAQAESKKPTE